RRWRRAEGRLSISRYEDAVADLFQLEAAAHGAQARFHVCLEAGRMLRNARLHHEARTFFERALRYAPRSPEASVGLARAFLEIGEPQRGVALLSRAVSLLQPGDAQSPAFVLELAQALAEHASDLPAAIYHARSVPFGLRETVAARALEGRWRHQLDDRAGASQAYAQAREAAIQLPPETWTEHSPWLAEAANFELDVMNEPLAAKQHAEFALRGLPHEPSIMALFRRVARAEQQAAHRDGTEDAPSPGSSSIAENAPAPCPTEPPPPAPATIPPPEPLGADELDAADEARIEALTDAIRANPNDHGAVRELSSLLERAQRHLDLLALLSARLEETTDERLLAELRAIQERTLRALVETCRTQGRLEEAEMYELVLADLDSGGSSV
ncbi:MAG: tetratricopeptide repeat protein, partial [Myxococcota bacterium]